MLAFCSLDAVERVLRLVFFYGYFLILYLNCFTFVVIRNGFKIRSLIDIMTPASVFHNAPYNFCVYWLVVQLPHIAQDQTFLLTCVYLSQQVIRRREATKKCSRGSQQTAVVTDRCRHSCD